MNDSNERYSPFQGALQEKRLTRSTAAKSGPGNRPGAPDYASAQALRVLSILKQAGSAGVSRERFLTPSHLGGYGITQVGTRIHELEELGFIFEHRKPISPAKFTTYILRAEPMQPVKITPTVERQPSKPHVKKEPQTVEQSEMFSNFMAYETGRER